MRLWSLHPKYLDSQGLVALWREGLLARAVLRGHTHGYKHHPQLDRFVAHAQPRLAINAYLAAVHAEAEARGYSFDRTKIGPVKVVATLAVRSRALYQQRRLVELPRCHPLFRQVKGPLASWERVQVVSGDSVNSKPLRGPA